MSRPQAELLKGTLDMLILRALLAGPVHGYGIARWIEDRAGDLLAIEEGSLYPALYRLERRDLIVSEWGMSDNNRRAKFYRLTEAGEQRFEADVGGWERLVEAIARVLAPEPAGGRS